MMKTWTGLGLAALLTAACQPTQQTGQEPLTCNADAYKQYIGGPVDAVQQASSDDPIRILRRDQVVTADYLSHRVNIAVDDQDMVVSVRCG